jgi:hypothetical protein
MLLLLREGCCWGGSLLAEACCCWRRPAAAGGGPLLLAEALLAEALLSGASGGRLQEEEDELLPEGSRPGRAGCRAGCRAGWPPQRGQPAAVPYLGRRAGFVYTYSLCAVSVIGAVGAARQFAPRSLSAVGPSERAGSRAALCVRVGGRSQQCPVLGLRCPTWCGPYATGLRPGSARSLSESVALGMAACLEPGPGCAALRVSGRRRGAPGYATSHSMSGVLTSGPWPSLFAHRRS